MSGSAGVSGSGVSKAGVSGAGVNASRSPVLDLRFFRGYLPSGITFTRSTKAWDYDSTGTLEENASGDPRFDYDPDTLKSLGLLVEEQRTNSLLDNRDLSTGNWTKSNSPGLSQNETGIDGVANTAWTITDVGSDGISSVRQAVTISNDSARHVVVAFVKKDSDTSRFPALRIRMDGGTRTEGELILNTSTGDVSNNNDAAPSDIDSEDAGDWWKITLSLANNNSGNTTLTYWVFPAWNESGSGSFSLSATGSIVYDFGGVRLNASTFGSPIETGSSAVTVNADDANMPLPSELASGFVWVIHARTGVAGIQQFLGTISNDSSGTPSSRVWVFRIAGGDIRFSISGTSVDFADPGDNTDIKFAFRVGSSPARVETSWAGGSDISASVPSGLSEKFIAQRSNSIEQLSGTIALDRMYANPGDWSDADLQEASS